MVTASNKLTQSLRPVLSTSHMSTVKWEVWCWSAVYPMEHMLNQIAMGRGEWVTLIPHLTHNIYFRGKCFVMYHTDLMLSKSVTNYYHLHRIFATCGIKEL